MANQLSASRRAAVLAALCLAAFIINLDTTIVNVALPSLVRELGAGTTNLQWIVDAYNLVFAAFILVAGSLSDRFGRKGFLVGGLVVFGAASLAGAFATTSGQLIATRSVMGLGAAMIFPSTLSLISNIFVERVAKAKAIGLWGATTGVGIATGPIFGGWLLEHFWWGSIFVFLVPIAAGIAVLAAWVIPASRDPRTPKIDRLGFVLSIVGMGAVISGVIQAPSWGWGSSATIGMLATGIVFLLMFVAWERRIDHPMLDVSLFSNPRFTAASASVTVAFFALSGFIFLTTQYFQFVKVYSPLGTGVRLLPVAASVAVASLVGTALAVRIGNKVVVGTGMAFFSVAMFWISSRASQSLSYGVIATQMVVLGLGMGLTTAPATEAIMGAVPKEKAGVGSAVNDATRLFGGTLGVAVIGSVAASLYLSRLRAALPALVPHRAAIAAKASVGGASIASQHLEKVGLILTAQRVHDASTGSFLYGFAGGCRVAGAAVAVGAALAIFLLPARPRTEKGRGDGSEVSPPTLVAV